MKVKCKWYMLFRANYCKISGEHDYAMIGVYEECDNSNDAIFGCWRKALRRANSPECNNGASLISLELMDAQPYIQIDKEARR